ncbi:MAG: ribosomal protein S18-alanine N-acetyltransferase [Clostridia bacterium]|nr:ribosomal protein S18-alanine N-acetyltransferase [Clostridia bacterium]
MKIKEISTLDIIWMDKIRKDFADAWNENMLKSAFNGGRFFGYKVIENDIDIGFITLTRGIDEVDLEMLYVLPEYRNKGYATALLDKAIERCKEFMAQKIFLEVKVDNTSAKTLYEKKGFKVISERKKYYADGKNAYVMIKEI